MVKREDYDTVSEFDAAFNSAVFSESAYLSMEVQSSEDDFEDFEEEFGNAESTASNFEFEIFSESGYRMQEVQNLALKEKFPEFSLLEELPDSDFNPLESWKEDISDFARQILEDMQ
ncbi:MAG: hypothetical protein ACK5LM_00730 [Lactovum sp.]